MHTIDDKEKWQIAFRQTAEELACLETLDLANMSDEEALRRLHSLGTVERPWRERSDWSGLVEWQALLHGRRAE